MFLHAQFASFYCDETGVSWCGWGNMSDSHDRNILEIHRWFLFGSHTRLRDMFVFHVLFFVHVCFLHEQFGAGSSFWSVLILHNIAISMQHEIEYDLGAIHVPVLPLFCFQASNFSVCHVAGRGNRYAMSHWVEAANFFELFIHTISYSLV